MTKLSGKTIWITGASSGIGEQLSYQLAEMGNRLILSSRRKEELERVKNNCVQSAQKQIHILTLDLADLNSLHKAAQSALNIYGSVDVLINNAGMLVYGEAITLEYSTARSILNLHMTTPALLCRLFGEKMKENGQGYILNVSSISAVMPYPTISTEENIDDAGLV